MMMSILLLCASVATFAHDDVLSPGVVRELELFGEALVINGAYEDERHRARFLDEQILSPLLEYRLVTDLPRSCYRESAGVACTDGMITFVHEEGFAALGVRGRAQVILRARLIAHSATAADEHVDDVASALGLTFSIRDRKKAGEAIRLSAAEVEQLSRLPHRLMQVGLSSGKGERFLGMRVTELGGGWIGDGVRLAQNAFVDPLSNVNGVTSLEAGVEVWSSVLLGKMYQLNYGTYPPVIRRPVPAEFGTLSVGAGSKLIGVNLRGKTIRIGAGTSLERATLHAYSQGMFQDDAMVVGSSVTLTRVNLIGIGTVEDGAHVEESLLDLTTGGSFRIAGRSSLVRSVFDGIDWDLFEIGEGGRVESVNDREYDHHNHSFSLRIGKQAALRNIAELTIDSKETMGVFRQEKPELVVQDGTTFDGGSRLFRFRVAGRKVLASGQGSLRRGK